MKTIEVSVSDEQFEAIEEFSKYVRATPGELLLALAGAEASANNDNLNDVALSALRDYCEQKKVPLFRYDEIEMDSEESLAAEEAATK